MNIINEIAMEIYQAQLPTIGPDKATRWKSGPNPTSPARGSGRCKSRPRARGGIRPCLGKSVVAPSSALSGGPIEWWHYGFNELICVDLGAEKLGVSSFRSWHVLACFFSDEIQWKLLTRPTPCCPWCGSRLHPRHRSLCNLPRPHVPDMGTSFVFQCYALWQSNVATNGWLMHWWWFLMAICIYIYINIHIYIYLSIYVFMYLFIYIFIHIYIYIYLGCWW